MTDHATTGGEGSSFESVEARAEAWSDRVEIQDMVEATTAVFAKWSSPEILSRFRQQTMAVIQQAFIEGFDAASAPRGEGAEAVRGRICSILVRFANIIEDQTPEFRADALGRFADELTELYPSGAEAPSVVGADAKVLTQSAGRVKTLGEALALYAKHGGTVVSPNDAAMVADDITIILAALSSAQTGQDQ